VAEGRRWAFVTSHGAVLIEVARQPDATVRQIAERIGLTERQAHRVLSDLVNEDYIVRERVGRRNKYRIHADRPMRHAILADRQIGELLASLLPKP
jgi:DNA-binding IclR family transcriptional regulator